MQIKITIITLFFLAMSGCGGGGCPAVFIPVYEVNVYDSISGELLCTDLRGLSSTGECEISYTVPEGQTGTADISVELQGYESQVMEGVENQAGQHVCFDSWDYTASVDVFLERTP